MSTTTRQRTPPFEMLPKEVDRLKRMVETYLLDHGASESGGWGGGWNLPTRLGNLRVSLDKGTIFQSFDEPARAASAMGYGGPNPHSGKWNFHNGRKTAAAAFSEWLREIEKYVR